MAIFLLIGEDDLKKVLTEAGCEVNGEEVTKTITNLKGKELHDVIKSGKGKLANMSFGAAPSGGAATTTTSAPAKTEAKEVAKPKEEVEEVNLGGGGLFGDDEEWWKYLLEKRIEMALRPPMFYTNDKINK